MVVGELPQETELAVLGGGPGGYTAALRAAKQDVDVTLIEADAVGGTCLNSGCIPSKALIHAADFLQDVEEARTFGVKAEAEHDYGKTQSWKDDVVASMGDGVKTLCDAHDVEVVEGRGSFVGEDEIRVEGVGSIEFDSAILATGSRPMELEAFEFDGDYVIDSETALDLEELPDSIVVVGAGYIGMELSTSFAKMGVDVRVVEAIDSVLPGYDDSLTRYVERRARELDVDLSLGEAAVDWVPWKDGVEVVTDDGEQEHEYGADCVLVAVGRIPRTNCGLEEAGVRTDSRGFVVTDERTETTNPDVYAVGDCASEPMLAHHASYEGRIAADVVAGREVAVDSQAVPAAVYTDPEIATVGLTPDEAREQGFDAVVGESRFGANGRAVTRNEVAGFVRVVADEDTGFVLGGQIVGPEASELVSELALAIEMGATVEDVDATIHVHPTLSEAVMEAAADCEGKAVHSIDR